MNYVNIYVILKIGDGNMKEIILETFIDTLKIVPFLVLTFLLIEIIEHKIDNKKIISKTGRFGPLFGSIMGAFPQCGFSVSITNLYATRIVTLGTLISVYLSTSDEMLPIMLSQNVEINVIFKFLAIKVIIGMLCGFVIDLLFYKKQKIEIKELCEHDHCHCEKNIFVSSLKHTFNIVLFILLISFMLNLGFEYLGEEIISKIFLKNNLFSSFISSLIGLIPNCGASVILTELYLNNTITFGSCLAGLLTGSGVAILILFKVNKDYKENLKILSIVYVIGVVSGIIIDMISLL